MTGETTAIYDRSIQSFADQIETIDEHSKQDPIHEQIVEIVECSTWSQKIAILAGQEFDDIGIARASAVKAVAQAFNKAPSEVEDDVEEAGSVSEAVKDYEVTWEPTTDSVDELYHEIEKLDDKRGDKQISHFALMLEKYTVPWVVSFAVVGEMKIGIGHSTICSAAGTAYGYTDEDITRGRALIPNSREFVEAVRNNREVGEPQPGKPFKPMKAKSISLPEDTEDWVAQIKLDGYRSIIHVDDGDVQAFSSSLNERTGVLPELQEIDWPDGQWIFDSEVMADDGEYSSTSERMQRKAGSTLPHTMNFWVFDVLIADGEDMTREPFSKRLDALIEHAPMDERVIPVYAHDDIDEARQDAIDNGYEGTIVKHKDHEFEFGKRSKKWIKDKLTTETVDLEVVGFQPGTGSNAGSLGAIELATSDGYEIGKVGTGFTDRQRDEIWENRDDWRGSVVEIQFDADEGYEDGLRFPSFLHRRQDKAKADDQERLDNIAGDN